METLYPDNIVYHRLSGTPTYEDVVNAYFAYEPIIQRESLVWLVDENTLEYLQQAYGDGKPLPRLFGRPIQLETNQSSSTETNELCSQCKDFLRRTFQESYRNASNAQPVLMPAQGRMDDILQEVLEQSKETNRLLRNIMLK